MNGKKIFACILSLMLIVSLFSCVTGQYMKSDNNENERNLTLCIFCVQWTYTNKFIYQLIAHIQMYTRLIQLVCFNLLNMQRTYGVKT